MRSRPAPGEFTSAHVVPLKEFEQFAPYWTAEAGWHTDLQLRNNLALGDLTVHPFLRTPDGQETELPSVTLLAGEVRSINLMDVLTSLNSNLMGRADAYGSIALRYKSKSMRNLYASVMVHDTGHPIMYHLDAYSQASKFIAGSREGVWWLPTKGTKDYLILVNQSDHPLVGTLSLFDAIGKAWSQPLFLAARQTQRLSVRNLLEFAGLTGNYGGIKVEVPQGIGSLDTVHLLFDEAAGFGATMKMFDADPKVTIAAHDFGRTGVWTTRAPMLALRNPDPALAFPPKTILRPFLLLRNTTSREAKANLDLHWRSETKDGRATLPRINLGPFETRKVDVGDLQMRGVLPLEARWAQVTLRTDTRPNELMAIAASYSSSFRYGAQTPFSDQLSAHLEGGQWQADADHTSLIAAGNGGTGSIKSTLTLFYEQGRKKYQLEKVIESDDQWFVNIGQLIRNQVPDLHGTLLPTDLQSGSYQLTENNQLQREFLYEGKVITDKRFGHATYGCMVCCGYGGDAGLPFINPGPMSISGTSSVSADVYAANACTGNQDYVTNYFPTWSSDNTGIMSASFAMATGVYPGGTNLNANATRMPSGDGEDQREACPYAPSETQTPTTVVPTVSVSGPSNVLISTGAASTPTIQLTATGNPAGGTYTWTVSDSKLSVLSSNNSANVTIAGSAAGQSSVSVSYTVNGTGGTGSQQVNIQQPANNMLNSDTGNQTKQCTYIDGSPAYQGVQRTVGYQLYDSGNPSQPILIDGVSMTESFSTVSDGCDIGAPPVQNGPTTSGGKWGDGFSLCTSACTPGQQNYNPSCQSTFNHTWKANGFPVFNKVLTYACSTITP